MPHGFRFLDSQTALDQLCDSLGRVGLQREPVISEQSDVLSFRCMWLDEPVEIRWSYNWDGDGMFQEDNHIFIVYAGNIQAQIDVNVGLPEGKPLRDAIIDEIVSGCAKLTGKHKQA